MRAFGLCPSTTAHRIRNSSSATRANSHSVEKGQTTLATLDLTLEVSNREVDRAEPPIRIIQGPRTMLNYSDNVTLDPVHREAYVAQLMNDAILVFRSDAGGDVAPIRVIHGPKTKLDRPVRVSVDPVSFSDRE